MPYYRYNNRSKTVENIMQFLAVIAIAAGGYLGLRWVSEENERICGALPDITKVVNGDNVLLTSPRCGQMATFTQDGNHVALDITLPSHSVTVNETVLSTRRPIGRLVLGGAEGQHVTVNTTGAQCAQDSYTTGSGDSKTTHYFKSGRPNYESSVFSVELHGGSAVVEVAYSPNVRNQCFQLTITGDAETQNLTVRIPVQFFSFPENRYAVGGEFLRQGGNPNIDIALGGNAWTHPQSGAALSTPMSRVISVQRDLHPMIQLYNHATGENVGEPIDLYRAETMAEASAFVYRIVSTAAERARMPLAEWLTQNPLAATATAQAVITQEITSGPAR